MCIIRRSRRRPWHVGDTAWPMKLGPVRMNRTSKSNDGSREQPYSVNMTWDVNMISIKIFVFFDWGVSSAYKRFTPGPTESIVTQTTTPSAATWDMTLVFHLFLCFASSFRSYTHMSPQTSTTSASPYPSSPTAGQSSQQRAHQWRGQ